MLASIPFISVVPILIALKPNPVPNKPVPSSPQGPKLNYIILLYIILNAATSMKPFKEAN